jgi:hypothetical protein
MCYACTPGFKARCDQEIAVTHKYVEDLTNTLRQGMELDPAGTDLDWLTLLLAKFRAEFAPEHLAILAAVALIRIARDKAPRQEVLF